MKSLRTIAVVTGLLWICICFASAQATVAQTRSAMRVATLPERLAVQETISDEVARRVKELNDLNLETRLAKIEAFVENSSKSSDATRQLLIGVIGGVAVLLVEALMRFFSTSKREN